MVIWLLKNILFLRKANCVKNCNCIPSWASLHMCFFSPYVVVYTVWISFRLHSVSVSGALAHLRRSFTFFRKCFCGFYSEALLLPHPLWEGRERLERRAHGLVHAKSFPLSRWLQPHSILLVLALVHSKLDTSPVVFCSFLAYTLLFASI